MNFAITYDALEGSYYIEPPVGDMFWVSMTDEGFCLELYEKDEKIPLTKLSQLKDLMALDGK